MPVPDLMSTWTAKDNSSEVHQHTHLHLSDGRHNDPSITPEAMNLILIRRFLRSSRLPTSQQCGIATPATFFPSTAPSPTRTPPATKSFKSPNTFIQAASRSYTTHHEPPHHSLPRRPQLPRPHLQPQPKPQLPQPPPQHDHTRRQLFSVLSRPPPSYPGQIPLTPLERLLLATTSGLGALHNPYRGDLISLFAETTSTPYFLPRLRRAMLLNSTGRRILRLRPRITSTSLNLPYLLTLPENTLGKVYAEWLEKEGVSPDTRPAVRYVQDEELAYILQRYRESHDFYHALTGLPIVREGEIALKAFEFANTLLPMTGLAVASVATLKGGERERFWKVYGPWALKNGLRAKEVINVFWEEEMGTDVGVLRRRLGIERAPDMRAVRAEERAENRRRKEMEREGGM